MSIVLVVLGLLCMVSSALIASRKGYNVIIWLFAGNPLAPLILLSQPSTISGPYPLADELKRRKRVNRLGIFLIIVNVVLILWLLASMNSAQVANDVDTKRPSHSVISKQEGGYPPDSGSPYRLWFGFGLR